MAAFKGNSPPLSGPFLPGLREYGASTMLAWSSPFVFVAQHALSPAPRKAAMNRRTPNSDELFTGLLGSRARMV
jgi:hypothetical protein